MVPKTALVVLACSVVPIAASAQAVNTPPQPVLAGVRLACFSPQRAFAESTDGKAALARLSALRDEKTRAIEAKNKELQAREQALEESAPLLDAEARSQTGKAVEKFRLDVQRFVQDAQAEMMGVQRELESAFVVKLKPAIERVAKDKGLQLVLNSDDGPVAWFDPSLDITSEVVKALSNAAVLQ